MILFNALFLILVTYLLVYCCYQLFFYIKANDIEKYFELQEKTRSEMICKNKLCVIVYATNKDKNLNKLLSVLNNQTYGKEHYDVHVVYPRDEQDTTTVKDFIFGARIHNIENPDYFSKDKALNLFIQKILPENKYDAFVFLGVNRIIGERYLENINKSTVSSGVIVGSKISINERNILAKKIKNNIISTYLKYINRTNNIVRSMFKLPFLVDGENFVITSDALEKMGYVEIEDKDSELDYSLNLASNNIKTSYSPYIITGIDVKYYDFENPSIKTKFALFAHYSPLFFAKSIAFKEFILFLLKPNSLIVLLSYFILFMLCSSHKTSSTIFLTAFIGAFLFINFIIAMNVSKMTAKEIFWLLFYPPCLTWQKIKIFMKNLSLKAISESKYEEENINSATINAIVNNGKKDIDCKLDLVSEDGMRKVIFREGNRFISTDSYLRMYDALEDISYKIATKGLTLKTCQNCQHFSISPDGTLDCLNGKCSISQSEILIWNGCQYFYQNSNKKNEE